MSTLKFWQADACLVVIAVIWGSTFVLIKDALADITPHAFLTLRFVLAAIFMLLLLRPSRSWMSGKTLRAGMITGIFLFLGYSLQTVGLYYTSAGKAAFITGLSVIIAPLIQALWKKEAPAMLQWIGSLLACVGLALLCLNERFVFSWGDLLVLGCAVCLAMHIVLIAHYTPHISPNALSFWQVAWVGVLSGGFWLTLPSESFQIAWSREVIVALLVTAILATALAMWLLNRVQQYTTVGRTALILTLEPLTGALIAAWWAHEVLGVRGWLGGAAILLGMVLAEWEGNRAEKIAK